MKVKTLTTKIKDIMYITLLLIPGIFPQHFTFNFLNDFMNCICYHARFLDMEIES